MASVINQIKLDNTEYAIAASAYAESTTASSVAAKVATICTDDDTTANQFELIKGVSVQVQFSRTNTADMPTLNVNSTGAKQIYYAGNSFRNLQAGVVYTFVYDGTRWALSGYLPTQNSVEQSSLSAVVIDSDSGYDGPLDVEGDSIVYENGMRLMYADTYTEGVDKTGFVLNFNKNDYNHQILIDEADGSMFHRNNTADGGEYNQWAQLVDTHNYRNLLDLSGGGDMLRSVYDTDYDGIVDSASYAETAGSADSAVHATSATALDSNAGSTTQPVYFSGGKPVATTYKLDIATSTSAGLISVADKKKLDGLATVATSGSYNDLSNKPTIPDVSGYLPKSGGTMTGSIITPKDDNMGIIPHTNNYGQIGSSDKRFFRMYATTFYGDVEGDVKGDVTGNIEGQYYDGEDYYDLIHSGNISSQSVAFATKATQDASGNTITSTYATKTELTNGLAGKAASSHGTHVSYSTTNPVMDGTASVGSASTVARSDHRHPTDTSRAAASDLTSHTGNTTSHITSTERTNWNAAKTHASTAHAPSNAEKNQNAFSNITVGSTTIAADSTTDTLTLVAGANITLTPDATNDKITISATGGGGSGSGGLATDGSNAANNFGIAAETISITATLDGDASTLDLVSSGNVNIIGDGDIDISSGGVLSLESGSGCDLNITSDNGIYLYGDVYYETSYGSFDTLSTLDDRVCALEGSICLQEGTQILMADGTTKNIENVRYGDMIMTYDIDNNEVIPCKSYGCMFTGYTHTYNHYCFDNGSILKVFGGHRLYDADKQELVYFSKMNIGDHTMTPECVPATYCYSPSKVPASVSTRKFTIFCETGLYFANNILCGHPLCQPLDLHIRTHGSVKLSDEDKATLQAYADARDNDYQVELSNPEYVKEAMPFWKEQQAAKRKIQENKDSLAARDYKTIKAMQGKLTEEEITENVSTCEELRAKINEEEAIVAKSKKNIKALQDKYNIHPRKLQVMETINVKDAIKRARERYKE